MKGMEKVLAVLNANPHLIDAALDYLRARTRKKASKSSAASGSA